jgi:ADP-ribose pyrophosphatase YjhB (NUDIX family)
MEQIANVFGIAIRNKKILLLKKEGLWILPGGKYNPDGDYLDSLIENIQNQLPLSRLEFGADSEYFVFVEDQEGVKIRNATFFIKVLGDHHTDFDEEKISEAEYFSQSELYSILGQSSSLVQKIISKLISEGKL